MKGYKDDIEKLTLGNNDFRHVLYTGEHSQLVLMCLRPNEEIGSETHADNDQFFRFETGRGKAVIDCNEYDVSYGTAVIVPAVAKHNIINVSDEEPLRFYTIYSPPHHKDGIIHTSKAEAEAHEEEFDGVPTE